MTSWPENLLNTATYQEWERRAGPGMRARYADFAPYHALFEIRPDDIPAVIPGFRIEQNGELAMVSGSDGQGIAIRGLSAANLVSALSRLDGKSRVSELSSATDPCWPVQVWRDVLQGLLGIAIDLPTTFAALSQFIERTEIVRFPEQPARAVWRNYWENAAAVRRHLPEFYLSLDDPGIFSAALARLHVFATVGQDCLSYYGGYGLIPTVPGGYREIGVQTAIPDTLLQTLERWSSSLEAGPVVRAGGIATPAGQAMVVVQDDGKTVIHAALGGALHSLLDESRAALKSAREAIVAGKKSAALNLLAVFHQTFVNAHPFANINNSIAMNIVNDCLRTAGQGHLPHLFLDYLAQRLTPDRYSLAFARTVDQYALSGDEPAPRRLPLANCAALYWRYRADRDGATAAV